MEMAYLTTSSELLPHGNGSFCEVYLGSMHRFMINVTFIAIILSSLALFSNSLFLFTVVKQRHLRQTPVRVYLASLSFIDACVSISFTLLAFRWLLDSANKIYSFNVHLVLLLRFPFQLMSSLLIVMVTLERYKAIYRPMAHYNSNQGGNDKFCFYFVGLACPFASLVTIAVVIVMVICFEFMETIFLTCPDPNVVVCVRKLPENVHEAIEDSVFFINYLMAILDLLTIFSTVFLSALICIQLGRLPELGSSKRYAREQRNMTKMVVANTLVFCLFVLLLDICSCLFLSTTIMFSDDGIKIYLFLVFSLTLINSGINPVIYNTFGSVYRTAFLKTFPCFKFAGSWVIASTSGRSSTSLDVTQLSSLPRFNGVQDKVV